MAAQIPGRPPMAPTAGMKRVAAKKVAAKKPAPIKWEEQYAAGSPSKTVPGGKTTIGSLVGRQYSKGVNADSEESYGMLSDRKKPVVIPSLAINLAKVDRARGSMKRK
jgi:hypothetical protein